MRIVPNGSFKQMRGQSFKTAQFDNSLNLERDTVQQNAVTPSESSLNPLNMDNFNNNLQQVKNDNSFNPPVNNNANIDQNSVDNTKGVNSPLVDKIVSFLGEHGWEQRLILKFKDQIYQESFSNKGGIRVKNVIVTVPNFDLKTGENLDPEKLEKIISEHTGLVLETGKSSGKQLILNFTSGYQKDENSPEDVLEGIYGKNKKTASTLSEMIEARKEELYNKMRKTTGAK